MQLNIFNLNYCKYNKNSRNVMDSHKDRNRHFKLFYFIA